MNQENDNVIKHLEMLQAVITRLAQNSFWVKGGSLTLLGVILVFMVRNDLSAWFAIPLLVPIVTFWGLDAYFLWQERLFRHLYNDVRTWQETDFSMPLMRHRDKERWWRVAVSRTLAAFYGMQFVFVVAAFVVVWLTS